MNHNKNVVVFTLVTTFTLLFYSFYAAFSHASFFDLNKISILSDVLKDDPDTVTSNLHADAFETKNDSLFLKKEQTDTPAVVVTKPKRGKHTVAPKAQFERSIYNYTLAKTLTNFNTDHSKPSLPELMHKLHALKQGKKRKIRIAWFGDSMIEGDLLSQTFRKRMQQFFGAYGVGFVPANSVTASFRSTVMHKWKGDWKEENFKTKQLSAPLFLSGHTYFTNDGVLSVKDLSFRDSTQSLEKCLICGPAPGGVINIVVNGKPRQYRADNHINRLILDSSTSHSIDIAIQNDKLPVYGVTIEPRSGIVVDNFSFRGITGLELSKLDTTALQLLESVNPYDLVILEYGANLMFRPNDVDYSWYKSHIIPVVKKLQKAMPNTEFLIISAADRAFRYDEKWKTAVGMDNLVKTQAELAYKDEAAFYNMYASMGGAGTIVNWADSSPSLANKDYIHPNFRGAEVLGNMLYEAFMKDYQKAAKGKEN
jgi:lysophospholipase L1-like esterase